MVGHQRHHYHGQGASGATDHAWATTDTGGNQTDHKGSIQPYQRVYTSDKGKGHRFWHQRQGDSQARKDITFKCSNFIEMELKLESIFSWSLLRFKTEKYYSPMAL